MTQETWIRIVEALAPVVILLAFVAWLLCRLDKAGQHLPHQYSTENSHEVIPGKSRRCPVANCSICGEGQ